MEIWKDLPEKPDAYEVSNQGRIRKKSDGKVLRTSVGKIDGYGLTTIRMECGKYKTVAVHSQVAKAFCQKSPEQTQVHHKNGDKTDNRAGNLEWLTPREHAAKDAELRRKAGRTTKRLENQEARKKLDFENMEPRVPSICGIV